MPHLYISRLQRDTQSLRLLKPGVQFISIFVSLVELPCIKKGVVIAAAAAVLDTCYVYDTNDKSPCPCAILVCLGVSDPSANISCSWLYTLIT